MRHLSNVSNNCVINLMEPRNLAIVFGPSVVRTSSETLESAVKDMKHQCRIVEAFVIHVSCLQIETVFLLCFIIILYSFQQYLFFFENKSLPQLNDTIEASTNSIAPTSEAQNTTLLLNNVAKIERKFLLYFSIYLLF